MREGVRDVSRLAPVYLATFASPLPLFDEPPGSNQFVASQ